MLRRSILRRAAILCLSAPAFAGDSAPGVPACSSLERDAYLGQVRQSVTARWSVPEWARAVGCTVIITQNFRGEVLDARVEDCPEDPRIRKSVKDAAYEASPLPTPANRACRDRVLRLRLTHGTRAPD